MVENSPHDKVIVGMVLARKQLSSGGLASNRLHVAFGNVEVGEDVIFDVLNYDSRLLEL